MTGSAQLEVLPEEAGAEELGPSALKREVAEKLAAHRERRALAVAARSVGVVAQPMSQKRDMGHPVSLPGKRDRGVAALIAERFAHTPSYRAVLEEEARRAIEEATAAAEIAARNAAAVVMAQGELLAELKQWNAPVKFSSATAEVVRGSAAGAARALDEPVKEVQAAGLTVRLYEDVGRMPAKAAFEKTRGARKDEGEAGPDAAEARALEDEIAFRQAPVFEEYRASEPNVELPANLLEFPRVLVASRKARPTLAEGPLRDEANARSPQLRIFEVEAEQIAIAPEPVSVLPEWSSIWLDAHTVTASEETMDEAAPALLPSLLPPLTAPVQLRAMAACVDAGLVGVGFVAFCAVSAKFAGTVTLGVPLGVGAAGALLVLWGMYQALFFTLSDQTPGMRYARIGLCTFSDENPSRKAMRKRAAAKMVSGLPLGLGILWALLDDDRLTWHDRLTRMYQRAY